MKKIAIFQSDFRVGGIQKALINVLNSIDYEKCAVDVYYFDQSSFFELPEHKNLRWIACRPYPYLNRAVYFDILLRIAPKVKCDTEYDIAVDFNSYRAECGVGALSVPAKKRVMWLHNDIEIKLRNEPKYKLMWHFFKGKFKYFDEFVAVSPGIIEGFRRATGIRGKKVTAISNHIDTEEIFRKSTQPIPLTVDKNCYNLCTMGRLCHQKGYDILLDCMAKVYRARPDMRLYMLGDGPDRQKLTEQIQRLGLGGCVTMLGNQSNPFPYLEKMDGFVLTSRYEGQGIVIWEAKTLGLELFISKNLEAYNPGIEGYDDIAGALISARRREKVRDDLHEYNEEINRRLAGVLELE
ncbi:MAG: glycosyltransferase [Butyricicoccus sp.]|nr:glycosyltransferase [Butyricicoccus sp.]